MGLILVVEDDADLRETYIDILEGDGHVLAAVETTARAIQFLTRKYPDVVLLDLQLPGDSGVLVLSFVRRFPRLRNTKVVVISGMVQMEKNVITTWGADLFLPKPITAPALRATVRSFCLESV
jgi:CheY-like chemotaxis protein